MPRIDRTTVDRIFEAARVEEIVADYVSLRRRGTNMLGLCPFHDEKTPSFMVSPSKGIYKCFGCGKGGNAINFVMEAEQISYYEALKHVAEKYHITIEEKELTAEEKKQFSDRDSMMVLNEFARKYFTQQMMETAEGRSVALSYFKERGFSEQIIEKFQLGFAPEGKDVFVCTALESGYKEVFLEKTGLAIVKPDYKRDRFAGRVIFPIHGQSGKVVAFAGRTLSTDKRIAKYINSPESDIYHKSHVLYGIYHAKKEMQRKDNCFLVEGYTDVMSLHQSGIENVVASSGTSLTQGQIRLIQRFTENVTVIYDGDNAGIKASLRGIDLILGEGLNVRVLLLPEGEDPDSFAKSMSASELLTYIEENSTDFIRFKSRLLMDGAEDDPVKKTKLIQGIMASVAVIPKEITRAEYIKMCSALLDVPEDTLHRECNVHLKKTQENKLKEEERQMNRQRYEQQKLSSAEDVPPTALEQQEKAEITTYRPEERMLMLFLLRYGEMKMFKEEEQYYEQYPDLKVADFILDQLEIDDLSLEQPMLNKMIEEYRSEKAKGNTNLERYFTHHDDAEIAHLAVDLTTDRYERSKLFEKASYIENNEERLGVLVPRVVSEFKLQQLSEQIEQIKQQLAAFEKEGNEAKANEAMRTYQELDSAKKELGKALGGRTLLGN